MQSGCWIQGHTVFVETPFVKQKDKPRCVYFPHCVCVFYTTSLGSKPVALCIKCRVITTNAQLMYQKVASVKWSGADFETMAAIVFPEYVWHLMWEFDDVCVRSYQSRLRQPLVSGYKCTAAVSKGFLFQNLTSPLFQPSSRISIGICSCSSFYQRLIAF